MTPEQEEQVRRALASLPPAPDMPPEVVDRLDARLADLVAEREGPGAEPESADDLAPRRRRLLPAMLVAAALAVVVGVGLGTMLDDITGGGMDRATSGSAGGESAPRTFAEEGAPPQEEAPQAAGDRDGEQAQAGADQEYLLTAKRLPLSSDTLRRDVSEVVDLHIPRSAAQEEGEAAVSGAEKRRLQRLFSPCAVPDVAPGDQLVAVRLDGEPATLLLRGPEDGTRVAQVYACGDASRVLARTEVSAR